VAEAGYDHDDLAWGAIQIAPTDKLFVSRSGRPLGFHVCWDQRICPDWRSWLKTTTSAQSGHQLRIPPLSASNTYAFLPENKRVTGLPNVPSLAWQLLLPVTLNHCSLRI
jgi:hypothetical protein